MNFWFSDTAYAHERWVPHELTGPVHHEVTDHWSGDVASVVGRTALLLALTALGWRSRTWWMPRVLGLATRLGIPARAARIGLDFITDAALPSGVLRKFTRFVQTFAVRVPAVVLMYSA